MISTALDALDSRTYAIRTVISKYSYVDESDFVGITASRLEVAKRKLAEMVFSQVFDCGHPVVLDSHLEEWQDFENFYYTLHYRMTVVQERNVVIPVFTFTDHAGVMEWKCPACSVINVIGATFCGEKHYNAVGCGRPRDKTRQEM